MRSARGSACVARATSYATHRSVHQRAEHFRGRLEERVGGCQSLNRLQVCATSREPRRKRGHQRAVSHRHERGHRVRNQERVLRKCRVAHESSHEIDCARVHGERGGSSHARAVCGCARESAHRCARCCPAVSSGERSPEAVAALASPFGVQWATVSRTVWCQSAPALHPQRRDEALRVGFDQGIEHALHALRTVAQAPSVSDGEVASKGRCTHQGHRVAVTKQRHGPRQHKTDLRNATRPRGECTARGRAGQGRLSPARPSAAWW